MLLKRYKTIIQKLWNMSYACRRLFEYSTSASLVVGKGVKLAEEAFEMALVLFNQLGYVVFVFNEAARLVERKLFKRLDLGVSQRNTLGRE